MNATADKPKFTIVGAGLAGTLMAVYLGKSGHAVDLYEKRSDPRQGGAQGGRSINLALSVRGIHALEQVGVADEILADAVAMKGRMMHSPAGELSFHRYGTDDRQCINSVSRAGLNIALLNAAEQYDNVNLFFDARCVGADLDAGTVEFANGAAPRTVACELVIGSDGAFSAIRAQMQRLDRFDYQQMYLTHGYKELNIPPGAGGAFQLEKHALHIWPRGGYMMIALPNADASFTCTLFWPLEGPHSFGNLTSAADVTRYFGEHFPDAVPLMPTLVEDYLHNPTSSLVTVRCNPWHHQGRFVLLGDAAHAVVPFYGQGMNASFEDCTVLNQYINEYTPDLQRAFAEYGRARKTNTDMLSELAISNFVEMRDRVASPGFLLKKKGELLLYKLLPGWFLPLYTMVTFTRIPYAEAVRKAAYQKRVLSLLMVLLVTLMVIGIVLV